MNVCRECHVDRDVVAECFADTFHSDNHQMAVHIIENCPECKDYFLGEAMIR